VDNLQILEKVAASSFAGFLLWVIYASYKRIWVWGSELNEMRSDRDQWKERALANVDMVQRLSHVASNAVGQPK
jgi:hypothetical protein